ncbi:MAG TPA: PDDEXK nuclease domain-containing protein [Humisphaera sp.]|nr:PDDEXK nuclease domain-containing protein [Humisphaera sp.]
MKSQKRNKSLYVRIRDILESARSNVARSVNTTQVIAYWLIGREIVEEEQKGKARAGYGLGLMKELSRRLAADYGSGFSLSGLKEMKALYLTYPGLLSAGVANSKGHAVRGLLSGANATKEKGYAARSLFNSIDSPRAQVRTAAEKSWMPGMLHPNLSWTHYRTLLRMEKPEARAFYEIEAIKNGWSARELERQINSLLYERLALSKDKKGLLRLAKKGHEVQTPADVFKDPMVMEFLGLPASHKLVESDLEQALIDNLQTFLLELGKGFAFIARQERITIDGDHFYIDLVFYHTILKCFVLLDLKVGKLTHQDLGQLQLYVNYYDRERLSKGDNPTLGLILCTDKNDAVVRYTLGEDGSAKIFARRYKLHVPTEAQLKAEIRRELRFLQHDDESGSRKPRSIQKH